MWAKRNYPLSYFLLRFIYHSNIIETRQGNYVHPSDAEMGFVHIYKTTGFMGVEMNNENKCIESNKVI